MRHLATLALSLAALVMLVQPAHAQASRRRCVNAYGTTACGYDCVAAYGQIRCAQTPAGACLAAYGQIVCGDPARFRWSMPRMQCTAAYGTIACGYGCTAAYGQVRCAQTPGGTCSAAYGQVQCDEGW